MRWLFALVLPLVWAAPFVYPPYGDLVQRLQSLNASHPGYVNVWSAQDAYGIGSAGICHDSAQKPTPCKQWFIQITDEISLKDHPERPEVFFSGNLHGDEQVCFPACLNAPP